MIEQSEVDELASLLDGLKVDAAAYFAKAERTAEGLQRSYLTNDYWWALDEQTRGEANRLRQRLMSLMGQVAKRVGNTPLTSAADQRDVMIATKVMRAAIMLCDFEWSDIEVLHNEDVVLGVKPASQFEETPLAPHEASMQFSGYAGRVDRILELVAASSDLSPGGNTEQSDTARYRPGTAFIMMWMSPDHPELTDTADSVKEVFSRFDIRGIRADDIEHEGLITERILNEIKTAEFCFADLSGERPNVYYEIGYAHALRRRVILYRKKGTGMHFDLAGYNCPEYENLRDLKDKLTQRLRALTNKEPRT